MKLSQPVKMTLGLFPLGSLAALVVWFVYVGQYGQDGDVAVDGRKNSEQATIAFQAVVGSVAVYYALHHHLSQMM